MFQQPFQLELDRYVRGEIELAELLERSEYYRRWRFDHRLYAPVLRVARDYQLELIALNIPDAVRRQVAANGFSDLAASERAYFPSQLTAVSDAFRARMDRLMREHPNAKPGDIERFVNVQSAWDEGMAYRAARYLEGS